MVARAAVIPTGEEVSTAPATVPARCGGYQFPTTLAVLAFKKAIPTPSSTMLPISPR